MKKLIFFDIDGTLVTENGGERIIPESTKKAIHKLQNAGHLCFINSGRTMSEIDESIFNLGMDGFVCGCGTNILYQGQTLFSHTIPYPLGNQILQKLEECNLEWLLEGKQTLAYSDQPYTTHIGDFQQEHQTVFHLNVDFISKEEAHDIAFDKFCFCIRPDSKQKEFQAAFSTELEFIDRGNGFYEAVPLGCSKASGIRFLMDYFEIPWEDTISIGDSTNDLPMLQYTQTSIAMGGSVPQVCEAATFVTDSVLEDGLYHAFEKLNLYES